MPTFREDIRLGTKVPQMKTEDYEDRSVTTEKLANEAVTSEKLGTGAVLRDNIQDGAVGTDEIANYSVTTEKLHDEAVTESKLAEHAVTSSILGNGAVERVNIQEGAVGTHEIENSAITIEKIAQAVWDKLKDEYLRIDGRNFMHSDLGLNDHNIIGVKEIENLSSLPIVISFDKDGYDVKLEKWETSGDDDPYPRSIGGFEDGSFEVPLDVTAVGFKTHNRSVLGLLNNNCEVITAMTDSDIDSCIISVFG